ncbi:restriction endonuclease [Streptomyces lonarensis]|uniref:Restriction endonuclease n=2 Tax=Streptomyces lonarensis TaxID=700599 RepID=A0A7X6D4E9_9ACTN|nr:restriction endonuclease [Streptomyces lonarensis]
MSPTAFEEACAELLVRDGFLDVRRVGGSGDLAADVLARDGEGRRVVVQCKRYLSPVGSGHLQRFNGTAVPEHGADLAVMVGLSGFTAPARAFAARHGIALVGDEELARWAVGTPLRAVLARPPDGGG